MGSCNVKEETVVINKRSNNNESYVQNNNNTIVKKEIFKDPKFCDMPEWEGERWKGYGIKKNERV